MFVCGSPNAGKSHLLREMFVDPRFGTGGVSPAAPRISPVSLSRERGLFVRCTSPHERYETIVEFFDKLDRDMEYAFNKFWRFNFACAIQPNAANNMPDIVETCRRFDLAFWPERIRVVQLHPPQTPDARHLLSTQQVDDLRSIGNGVEVLTIDARRASLTVRPNGFILADFFDFT
jgi:hypothetical protein